MVTNTFASVVAVVLLLCVRYDVINAFNLQPQIRNQYYSSHNQLHKVSSSNNYFRPLYAISESTDLLVPSLVSISFAAAAIYTFQHPETSDKIRDQFSSVVEKPSSTVKPQEKTAVTTTSSPSPSPPPAAAVKVQVPPVTTISTQEELSSILKSVSDTVEKQSVVLDSLRVKAETPPSSSVTETNKPKRKFITRLLIKVIKPWKPWNQL